MLNAYEQDVSNHQFQDVFKEYYAHVVRQMMRIVRDQAIAEDLAQEVFLQLYHTDWKQIENLSAWLAKAAIYASYNYLRSEKRHQARIEKEANYTQSSSSLSSEDQWMQNEEITNVQSTLKEMDERERTLLLMKFSGFQYKEIAQALHVEVSSIGTLLARAKSKFRSMYRGVKEE
ncbi:RNA polymerase sigma factor SigX [Microbacteriaceae bacterium 4G12]